VKKLLNDLKQLAITAVTAVKAAVRHTWQAAAGLIRRLHRAAGQKVAATRTTAAAWWQVNKTPIAAFVAVYALLLLFAVGAMVYAFYLERRLPEVKDWVDALLTGQLRLPGWQLTLSRAAAPTLLDLTTAVPAVIPAA